MNLADLKHFNWVKARVECDTVKLFSDLREAVHSDCDRAKEQSGKRDVLKEIVFENNNSRVFVVTHSNTARFFRLKEDSITVTTRKGKVLYTAEARLVGEECFIVLNDNTVKPWEFSRLALEDFFFNPPKVSD